MQYTPWGRTYLAMIRCQILLQRVQCAATLKTSRRGKAVRTRCTCESTMDRHGDKEWEDIRLFIPEREDVIYFAQQAMMFVSHI